jgi:hypothetical protein
MNDKKAEYGDGRHDNDNDDGDGGDAPKLTAARDHPGAHKLISLSTPVRCGFAQTTMSAYSERHRTHSRIPPSHACAGARVAMDRATSRRGQFRSTVTA